MVKFKESTYVLCLLYILCVLVTTRLLAYQILKLCEYRNEKAQHLATGKYQALKRQYVQKLNAVQIVKLCLCKAH